MACGPRTPKESSQSGSNLATPAQKDKARKWEDSWKWSEDSTDAASKSDKPVPKKSKAVSNNAASQDIAKELKAVSRDAACHDDNKTPKKHKTVSNNAAIKATTKDGATQKGTDNVIEMKDPRPPKGKEIYYLGSDSEEEGAKQLMELATEKIPSNRVLPRTIPPKIIYTGNTKMLSAAYLLASALDNALWFACLQCGGGLLIVNLRNLCQELSKSPQNQMDPQSYVKNDINQVLSPLYLLRSIEESFNLLYQSPMLPMVVIYPARNCVYCGIAIGQGWIYNAQEENAFCLPLNTANLVKVGYLFKKKPPPPSKSPRLKELLACPTQESSLSSAPVVESQVDATISPVESQVDKVSLHQTNVAGTSEDVEVNNDDDKYNEEDEDPSIAEMKNSPYYVRKGGKHHCVTVNTQWVHRMIASADEKQCASIHRNSDCAKCNRPMDRDHRD